MRGLRQERARASIRDPRRPRKVPGMHNPTLPHPTTGKRNRIVSGRSSLWLQNRHPRTRRVVETRIWGSQRVKGEWARDVKIHACVAIHSRECWLLLLQSEPPLSRIGSMPCLFNLATARGTGARAIGKAKVGQNRYARAWQLSAMWLCKLLLVCKAYGHTHEIFRVLELEGKTSTSERPHKHHRPRNRRETGAWYRWELSVWTVAIEF